MAIRKQSGRVAAADGKWYRPAETAGPEQE